MTGFSQVLVVVAVFVASPSPVHADSKASVEAAVRGAIDGKKAYLDGTHPWDGLYILDPSGLQASAADFPQNLLTPVPSGYDPKDRWSAMVAEIDWKLGPLALGVDEKHGVAWFQGAVALEIHTMTVGMNCCDDTRDAMRMSGVVVRDDADDVTAPIDKQIIATWFAKGGLAASSKRFGKDAIALVHVDVQLPVKAAKKAGEPADPAGHPAVIASPR